MALNYLAFGISVAVLIGLGWLIGQGIDALFPSRSGR